MMVIKRLLFILLLGFATSLYAENQSNQDSIYFLSLADIHFDPFISCYGISKKKTCPLIQSLREASVSEWPHILAAGDKSVPAYRLDTGYSLLKSTLAAAKQAADRDRVKFIFVLGDFIGHDYRRYYRRYARDPSHQGYQAFTNKTLHFLTNEIEKTFPGVSVYPVVGNNDTYSRDYTMHVDGQFLHDAASIWAPLIKNASNRAAMRTTFPYAGYYAITRTDEHLRVIVLNSVLFSRKAKGVGVETGAERQLSWLHQQLAEAVKNHQKVIMAMHIPVGIDVYATLRFKLFTLVEFWKPAYSKRFKDEINQYDAVIAGILSGHMHSDWFQIMTGEDDNEIAVTGTPSVSPIFGNNPGFKIYQYSLQSRQISDYYTYYLPIEEGKRWGLEYEFNRIYQPNCHLCSLIDGIKKLNLTDNT